MLTPSTTLCPSARAEEGALLLGVVAPDQSVKMLTEPEPLTAELAEAIAEIDAPEQQFRFANRCVKSGCNQWHDGRCGVIDLVMSFNQHLAEPVTLPACAIRSQCRWHKQNGPKACTLCPFIITDSSQTEQERLVYIDSPAYAPGA
ncbi:hypothetical protein HNV11_17605 [Spirosoma taeanense]|uniref:Nitrogen fixation protein n=1 Tax=Spirosoma taeanense TaxID=2735870 RepID=A0A6M5YCQ6_9BACT|nr:hypothetical protein [Spirosoma taeanense]QJW91060.1 hypothetical protein HNV11_17605 [Spirosoma taeanense]